MLSLDEHPRIVKMRRASPPANPELPPLNKSEQVETERMAKWLAERINSDAPIVEVVTLTPALARLLLARNTENRPISETNLDRIKRDIVAGHFAFNGEAIIVSASGELNDGQHRVRAVAETGRPIQTVMVFGPQRETRMTLDQGVVRTVGHYLGMKGFTDPNALAAAAGYLWQFRTAERLSTSGHDRPTKTETLIVLDSYRDLADSVQFTSRSGSNVIASRSLLAFVHYALKLAAGESDANDFINRLIDGNGLDARNPILYARNRLIAMKAKASGRPGDKAELIFRAWNLWIRGDDHVDRVQIVGGKLPKIERRRR
jgi:hypothetical protein